MKKCLLISACILLVGCNGLMPPVMVNPAQRAKFVECLKHVPASLENVESKDRLEVLKLCDAISKDQATTEKE